MLRAPGHARRRAICRRAPSRSGGRCRHGCVARRSLTWRWRRLPEAPDHAAPWREGVLHAHAHDARARRSASTSSARSGSRSARRHG